MGTLEKLYAICRGLNHRFADGDAPFQIMTRLLEECGELAEQVNHFEGKGVKREKARRTGQSQVGERSARRSAWRVANRDVLRD